MKTRSYQFISDYSFKVDDKKYTIKAGEILTGSDVGNNLIGFMPSELFSELEPGIGFFEIPKNNKIIKDMGTISEKVKTIDWSKLNPENVESAIQSAQAIMSFTQKSDFDKLLKNACGGKLTGVFNKNKKQIYRDCVAKFMQNNGYTNSGAGIGDNEDDKKSNLPPASKGLPTWGKVVIGVVVVAALTTVGVVIYRKYKK